MLNLQIRNNQNQLFEVTGTNKWDVLSVEGITPPAATITTSQNAMTYGETINNINIGKRNIIIKLNMKHPLDDNRQYLYQLFNAGEKIRLYLSSSEKMVYIDGYVESVTFTLFDKVQQPVISIICPKPLFIAKNPINDKFTKTISYSVYNDGLKTGAIFTMTINESVSDPTITNKVNGDTFTVEGTYQIGDVITINTNEGYKNVTLKRDGKTYNWMNNISDNSMYNWISIAKGDNEFVVSSDNIACSIYSTLKYQGV